MLKSKQYVSQKDNVFSGKVNNIPLNINNDERIQTINSMDKQTLMNMEKAKTQYVK